MYLWCSNNQRFLCFSDLTRNSIARNLAPNRYPVEMKSNTGAVQGAGAEALSGLGRAFFYAGSRSILATMYPVETTSARKLVTGLFELQERDHTLNRSQALRRSMLDMIDDGTMNDARGKIIVSYAHPLFWAPFIIVGDHGTEN